MTISAELLHVLAVVLPLVHLAGILLALDAVWRAHSPQAAIAWAISLISFPYATIPAYLVLGRSRFHGYVRARRSHDTTLRGIADRLLNQANARRIQEAQSELPAFRVLERLARLPFTNGNSAELLIDGNATFAAIFAAIETAKEYVLVQFYIGRDDELGTQLADLLKRKAAQGVRCYYLFDEIGSGPTASRYWRDLRDNGVHAAPFNTRRGGWRNRFQINFRNHRKIVVVDGNVAFVGGHNVGDDYLGKGPLGEWRDTHATIRGPVVAAVQMSFVEDWHWARDEVLTLKWDPPNAPGAGIAALSLPTGPVDDVETCSLMFSQLIQTARQRVWIASPYFVPDPQVLGLLQLASLRGVEVRILIPSKADHYLTHLASFAMIDSIEKLGVQFYRYQPGFLHQKVVLIDEVGVALGTANLDNRSLHLNFEITMLFADEAFAKETAKMLEADFARAQLVPTGELAKRKLPFRLGVQIAKLFSPIL